IACFGALHMLNQIVHIQMEPAMRMQTLRMVSFTDNSSALCKTTLVVSQAGIMRLGWLELIYIRWAVVFALLYSFAVMLLLRAKCLTNIEINLATSNAMMIIGFGLMLVLLAAILMVQQREPFVDAWCNDFIIIFMYSIALTTGVSVTYFLHHSCKHRGNPWMR
ncbi:hypothetical protein KR018_002040, partial [Drosophila ironensis]